MNDLLREWGPLILGMVGAGGVGGFLKVFFDRRLVKAQSGKTAVEGDVAKSSDYRAWAEQANTRATAAEASAAAARTEAEASRRAAWAAEDTAARCRREFEDLRDLILDCPRSGCPLRTRVNGGE